MKRRLTNLILIKNRNTLIDFLSYSNHHEADFQEI